MSLVLRCRFCGLITACCFVMHSNHLCFVFLIISSSKSAVVVFTMCPVAFGSQKALRACEFILSTDIYLILFPELFLMCLLCLTE